MRSRRNSKPMRAVESVRTRTSRTTLADENHSTVRRMMSKASREACPGRNIQQCTPFSRSCQPTSTPSSAARARNARVSGLSTSWGAGEDGQSGQARKRTGSRTDERRVQRIAIRVSKPRGS